MTGCLLVPTYGSLTVCDIQGNLKDGGITGILSLDRILSGTINLAYNDAKQVILTWSYTAFALDYNGSVIVLDLSSAETKVRHFDDTALSFDTSDLYPIGLSQLNVLCEL